MGNIQNRAYTEELYARDATIDIAKGIGIMLMVIGHYNGLHYIVRNFIFSFHMPLFFIFSGYFYRQKPMNEVVKKGVSKLVVPYVIVGIAAITLLLLANRNEQALQKLIGFVMVNGQWPYERYGHNLPQVGASWFFLALFWCKIYYNFLRRYTDRYMLFSFVISTLAFIIGKYITNIPFGLIVGACGMVFYAMGEYWSCNIKNGVSKYCLWIG